MSPQKRLKRDRSFGFTVSFILHVGLILISGVVFAKPIQYAVESGLGGIEVSLTAAPAEIMAPQPVMAQPVELPSAPDPDAIQEPQALPEEKPRPQEAQADGDGKDHTNFHSIAGAITEIKPDYLKNPAPRYPAEARQKGWEGVVVLRVSVDKNGRATVVEKESSSGFEVLDASAIKAVKAWRFRAAKVGTLSIESTVRVPIRFALENTK